MVRFGRRGEFGKGTTNDRRHILQHRVRGGDRDCGRVGCGGWILLGNVPVKRIAHEIMLWSVFLPLVTFYALCDFFGGERE